MAELVDQPTTNDMRESVPARPPAALESSRPGRLAASIAAPSATWLAFRSWPLPRQMMLILSLAYLAKQLVLVLIFPPFSGHDEVAHYSYLRTVAVEHRIPILIEDYLHDDLYRYCDYTLYWQPCDPEDERFLANPPHSAIWPNGGGTHDVGQQYAANHPPLYYFIMTPLYWLSNGSSPAVQQYLLRFAAIPFGLATVLLAYHLARTLFPTDGFLAVTVPAFVAFQPQISYEAAMVNNDILAIALYSAVLFLCVIGIRDRFPWRICVLLGAAMGLALLAKGTSLTALGLIGLAMLASLGLRSRNSLQQLITKGALIGVLTAAISAPWYIFLYRTYGNLSGLPQIEQIQWWNYRNTDPPGFFDMLFSQNFAVMRFHETWGYFGWRRIPLEDSMLWAIGIPLAIAFGGLVQYLSVALRSDAANTDPVEKPKRWQVLSLVLLLLTCVIAYLAVVQFGTRFALTQARYYFPAINAAALLLMLGLRSLIPGRFHPQARGLVVLALIAMNVMIYSQYVLPYWILSAT